MSPPGKGSVGLLMLGKPRASPDNDAPMPDDEGEDGGEDYGEAKADLARQFYEAGEGGDWKSAGAALEKFVHLCSE